MRRKIVKIDESKCNGCGLCVSACAEGALALVDGKARLVKESYCDGLGACLPECPTDAIRIEEREANAFDEEEVKVHLAQTQVCAGQARQAASGAAARGGDGGGCPGSAVRQMRPAARATAPAEDERGEPSQLSNWPVQLKLVPPTAPFLVGADIVVAADCTAFALADFNRRYLPGRVLVVGCPKLDDVGYYVEKLKEIFAKAKPKSVTVVRMEVPCCGGIAAAVVTARDEAESETPVTIETISIGGEVVGREAA